MRVALKLAYQGAGFHGYQRQPGLRTVEGDIRRALEDLGLRPEAQRFQSASRTDTGVSALGNAIALDTEFRLPGLLRALNSRLGDIWFWAWAAVGSDFRPRDARERWYRYYLPPAEVIDVHRLREAAAVVEGAHDFRGFTRARIGTRRVLGSVDVAEQGGRLVLDFRAQAFLWNMVRRLVAAMVGVASGRFDLGDLGDSLEGGSADFGLARPEGLVLMDVSYDFPFHTLPSHPSVGRLRALEARRWTEAEFLRELLQRMTAAPGQDQFSNAGTTQNSGRLAGQRTRNIKAENL